MFLHLLEVKAARAGLAYKQVNPRNTSLDCSRCKHRKPKKDLPLKVRVYECERCGLKLDRDVNAAINVLVRAFGDEARWGGATPRSGQHTPTTCGGPETVSAVSGGTSMTNSLCPHPSRCPRRALVCDLQATQYPPSIKLEI